MDDMTLFVIGLSSWATIRCSSMVCQRSGRWSHNTGDVGLQGDTVIIGRVIGEREPETDGVLIAVVVTVV